MWIEILRIISTRPGWTRVDGKKDDCIKNLQMLSHNQNKNNDQVVMKARKASSLTCFKPGK